MPYRCAKGKWNVRVLWLPSINTKVRIDPFFVLMFEARNKLIVSVILSNVGLDLAGVLAFQISISRSQEMVV
jgi:hypothetical protein